MSTKIGGSCFFKYLALSLGFGAIGDGSQSREVEGVDCRGPQEDKKEEAAAAHGVVTPHHGDKVNELRVTPTARQRANSSSSSSAHSLQLTYGDTS